MPVSDFSGQSPPPYTRTMFSADLNTCLSFVTVAGPTAVTEPKLLFKKPYLKCCNNCKTLKRMAKETNLILQSLNKNYA